MVTPHCWSSSLPPCTAAGPRFAARHCLARLPATHSLPAASGNGRVDAPGLNGDADEPSLLWEARGLPEYMQVRTPMGVPLLRSASEPSGHGGMYCIACTLAQALPR